MKREYGHSCQLDYDQQQKMMQADDVSLCRNAKPTDSDEEDADWSVSSDEDDDDPANWFEYDEGEESQGHPLVDPDDLLDLIRVDEHAFS